MLRSHSDFKFWWACRRAALSAKGSLCNSKIENNFIVFKHSPLHVLTMPLRRTIQNKMESPGDEAFPMAQTCLESF